MSAQIHDTITIFGNNYWMIDSPIKTYLDQNRDRIQIMGVSPSNTRGFYAKWVIEDGQLFLTAFNGSGIIKDQGKDLSDIRLLLGFEKITLADLFPYANNKIWAAWYTGFILVPYGPVIDDNDFLWGTIFKFTAHIVLECGIVVDYGGLTKEKVPYK